MLRLRFRLVCRQCSAMKRNRPRPRRVQEPKKVGLARYRKDQWQRWLDAVDDRQVWEESYDRWHRQAEVMAERLRRAGLEIVWVDLDVDEFTAWCESRGYRNDGESRSRYAAEQIGNIPPPQRSSGAAPASDDADAAPKS